jgi:hypothetical protein
VRLREPPGHIGTVNSLDHLADPRHQAATQFICRHRCGVNLHQFALSRLARIGDGDRYAVFAVALDSDTQPGRAVCVEAGVNAGGENPAVGVFASTLATSALGFLGAGGLGSRQGVVAGSSPRADAGTALAGSGTGVGAAAASLFPLPGIDLNPSNWTIFG